MTTYDILNRILEERKRQDEKWGQQSHTTAEWVAILAEEVGEAAEQANHYHFDGRYQGTPSCLDRLIKELVQVAAVAVAFIESADHGYADVTYTEGDAT